MEGCDNHHCPPIFIEKVKNMNRLKQADMIRKRNAELTEQINNLRFQLDFNTQLNMEGYKHAKDLINDLEKIKQDWISALNSLNNQRDRYSNLISDLQTMKNIMVSRGFKIPWHQKLINKLKGL